MKRKLFLCSGPMVMLGVLGVCQAQMEPPQPLEPFVTTVTVNPISNFNYTPVTIPSGKRLVVDYVSFSGAATSTSGGIQPIVILNTAINGGAQNLFYFGPQQSTTVSGQYYSVEKTVIYADSLSVGPAYSGYTPNFMTINAVISGHLIPIPPPPPSPGYSSPFSSSMTLSTPPRMKIILEKMGITAP